jgi:hypothetical protein
VNEPDYYQIAQTLLSKIIEASERKKRRLIWEELTLGHYAARWENTCKLIYIYTYDTHEVRIIDCYNHHEPFIIKSVAHSELCGGLRAIIEQQLKSRNDECSKCSNQKGFLECVVKSLSS